ncbi:MAG TPA: 50S ribosomal protein L22 [Armatimonadota bacterium]|jgi:large subunit ribosomal protein L22
MPEVRAVAKHIRMSPTKVRHVIDAVRGKPVEEALAILKFTPNRAAEAITKVVKSAAANALDRFDLDTDELRITRCFVDVGPTMKRIQPRAMGRAYRILKRTSHITVVVSNEAEAR